MANGPNVLGRTRPVKPILQLAEEAKVKQKDDPLNVDYGPDAMQPYSQGPTATAAGTGQRQFTTTQVAPQYLPEASPGQLASSGYTRAYLAGMENRLGQPTQLPYGAQQPDIAAGPTARLTDPSAVVGYDPTQAQAPTQLGAFVPTAPAGGYIAPMQTYAPGQYGQELTPYWQGTQPVIDATGAVAPPQLVSTQLEGILRKDSPLMQQARTFADQEMQRRGLLHSSMAVGAAQDAMIRQALPIAQSDAEVYERALTETTADAAESRRFQAAAENQRALAEGGYGVETDLAGAGFDVQVALENAMAKNREQASTADFANKERLDRELANLQAESAYALNNVRTKSSEYISQIQANTALTTQEKDDATRMALAGLNAENATYLALIDADTALTRTDKELAVRQVLSEGDNYTSKLLEMMDTAGSLTGRVMDNNTRIAVSQMDAAQKDMLTKLGLEHEALLEVNAQAAGLYQNAINQAAALMRVPEDQIDNERRVNDINVLFAETAQAMDYVQAVSNLDFPGLGPLGEVLGNEGAIQGAGPQGEELARRRENLRAAHEAGDEDEIDYFESLLQLAPGASYEMTQAGAGYNAKGNYTGVGSYGPLVEGQERFKIEDVEEVVGPSLALEDFDQDDIFEGEDFEEATVAAPPAEVPAETPAEAPVATPAAPVAPASAAPVVPPYPGAAADKEGSLVRMGEWSPDKISGNPMIQAVIARHPGDQLDAAKAREDWLRAALYQAHIHNEPAMRVQIEEALGLDGTSVAPNIGGYSSADGANPSRYTGKGKYKSDGITLWETAPEPEPIPAEDPYVPPAPAAPVAAAPAAPAAPLLPAIEDESAQGAQARMMEFTPENMANNVWLSAAAGESPDDMKAREDWLRTQLESQWRALQASFGAADRPTAQPLASRNVQLIQEALGIPGGSIHPDSGGYNNKGVYTGKGKHTKDGVDMNPAITGASFAPWFV